MTERHSDHDAMTRKILVGILVLAFVARVAAMVLFQTWDFSSDIAFGNEEGEIAYSLANGHGYAWPVLGRPVGPPQGTFQPDRPIPTAWKAPISPAIIATAFWFFGSYTSTAAISLELLQIAFSLLSCYLLFLLGKLVFNNDWPGLIAAFLFAIYPSSIHFSVQKIEYATLLTLLGLLILLQTFELAKRPGIARSIVLGALCGLALLVNPVIVANVCQS